MCPSNLQSAARTGISWLAGLLPRSADPQVTPIKSRRAVRRTKLDFNAVLCVANEQFPAKGVDFHVAGARVLADRPMDVDTLVFVHIESFGLVGFANVRHCSPNGQSKYAIGLQFRGELMQQEPGSWRFEHAVRPRETSRGSEASPYSMTPSVERDQLLRDVYATLARRKTHTV